MALPSGSSSSRISRDILTALARSSFARYPFSKRYFARTRTARTRRQMEQLLESLLDPAHASKQEESSSLRAFASRGSSRSRASALSPRPRRRLGAQRVRRIPCTTWASASAPVQIQGLATVFVAFSNAPPATRVPYRDTLGGSRPRRARPSQGVARPSLDRLLQACGRVDEILRRSRLRRHRPLSTSPRPPDRSSGLSRRLLRLGRQLDLQPGGQLLGDSLWMAKMSLIWPSKASARRFRARRCVDQLHVDPDPVGLPPDLAHEERGHPSSCPISRSPLSVPRYLKDDRLEATWRSRIFDRCVTMSLREPGAEVLVVGLPAQRDERQHGDRLPGLGRARGHEGPDLPDRQPARIERRTQAYGRSRRPRVRRPRLRIASPLPSRPPELSLPSLGRPARPRSPCARRRCCGAAGSGPSGDTAAAAVAATLASPREAPPSPPRAPGPRPGCPSPSRPCTPAAPSALRTSSSRTTSYPFARPAPAPGLLRAHVGGRPHDQPLASADDGHGRRGRRYAGRARPRKRLREPESRSFTCPSGVTATSTA